LYRYQDLPTEVAQAESSVLQSEVAYQLAVAAIQHATGKLLEPHHVLIPEIDNKFCAVRKDGHSLNVLGAAWNNWNKRSKHPLSLA
jgi:hypothetical protein